MTDRITENQTADKVFIQNLRVALRDRTSDYIKTYYECGDLVVEFYYHHDLSYYHKELCIYSKILSGLSSEDLAEQIIERYKKVLIFRHFKKKAIDKH